MLERLIVVLLQAMTTYTAGLNWKDRRTDRQTDRQTGQTRKKQTGRKTDGQTVKQTYGELMIMIFYKISSMTE